MVLSNRRNKGKLSSISDGSDQRRRVIRELDLKFSNSGSNDGLASSTIREIAILRLLKSHPHIVQILDVQITGDIATIQYPHYPISLREVLDSHLPTSVAREILHQICRGLSYMHEHQIVHRNLKPENIFLTSLQMDVGTVKIGDFTSARSTLGCPSRLCPMTPEEPRTRPHTEKERIRMIYRSPELLLRLSSYDTAVDVWSFGVIALEMLLGEIPWSSSTSESEMLIRIFNIFQNLTTNIELSFCVRLGYSPKITAAETHFSRISASHGNHACTFVKRLLVIDPTKRLNLSSALRSGFLLGLNEDDSITSPQIIRGRRSGGVPNHHTLATPTIAITGFLIKLARIIQAPNNVVVHMAWELYLRYIGAARIGDINFAVPVILATCLKIATRFNISRDAYKQVTCDEISQATRQTVTTDELNACEAAIINSRIPLFVPSDDDVISCLVSTTPGSISMLSQYIFDLILMDSTIVSEFGRHVRGLCAVILASQWIGEGELPLPLITAASVDEVQLAIARCANLVIERRARFGIVDNGQILKLLESVYRDIPKDTPLIWNTSREYLNSVIVRASRSSPTRTPSNRLLRSSTIQHANEWIHESRKRLSLSSQKRRRRSSSTPLPKRPRTTAPETPRRSARLQSKTPEAGKKFSLN